MSKIINAKLIIEDEQGNTIAMGKVSCSVFHDHLDDMVSDTIRKAQQQLDEEITVVDLEDDDLINLVDVTNEKHGIE